MDKGGFIKNCSGRVFRVMEYLDSYASTEQAEHAKAVYTRIKEQDYPESYAIVALLHDSLEDGYATKRELVDWLDVSEADFVSLIKAVCYLVAGAVLLALVVIPVLITDLIKRRYNE